MLAAVSIADEVELVEAEGADVMGAASLAAALVLLSGADEAAALEVFESDLAPFFLLARVGTVRELWVLDEEVETVELVETLLLLAL